MNTLANTTNVSLRGSFLIKFILIVLLGLAGKQTMAQCPTITCPTNIVQNVDPGECDAVVNYTTPLGTDPCASGSRTFNNCGATGRFGPTQSQVNSAYSGTDLQGEVTINTQGIQEWVVPFTGIYTIEASGAAGGQGEGTLSFGKNLTPGYGTTLYGEFVLNSGDILKIIVGQKGSNGGAAGGNYSGGGGGGSYVLTSSNAPLVVAAGGNGENWGFWNTSGPHGRADNLNIVGGTNGGFGNRGAGGAGLSNNGNNAFVGNARGGLSPLNGSIGGQEDSSVRGGDGGFGGGGGGRWEGGGGGGYSGGSVVPFNQFNSTFPNYGAGSYNAGSNQINITGANSGHGLVNITWSGGGSVTTTQTSGLPSGSAFPVGITTQTFEVNSTTSCSFTVEVIDNIPPSITAPADIVVNADPNSCLATGVVLGTPTTGDNCAVDVVSNDAPADFSIGTITVTWTVTDVNGNSNTATQSVTVNPPLSGLPTNTNTSTTFCSIQEAIDDPTTLAGHIIVVPAGTYTESVDVTKAVTLQGANQGIACTGTRSAESVVDAGATGTAFTISSNGVTIDGFSIKGAVGVSSENFSELTIVNNLVEAEYLGIAITGVSTSTATSAIADNCLQINNRLNVLSEPTAGIALGGAAGTNAITVADNNVSGDAFYGNLFFGINTVPTTTISGGNVTGATVGLGVVNSIDGVTFFSSTLDIDGFTASGFAGPVGAFQAGIYAFTGGLSSGSDVLTLNISNVNIDGVNNETTNSAGISLSDFSDQDANALIVADITGSTLTNNNPRGLLASGSTVATVTNSEFTGNGAQGTGYAFFSAETTTTGNGAADVTVENCIINHPSTSPGGVTAFVTNHNGTMTATNNSIDFNGNAQARGASTTVGGGNGGPIAATCNWWGTVDGPTIAGGITGDVSFELFIADGGDSGSAAPGFSPAGNCSGCLSGNTIENTDLGTFYCSIQEAIDDPNTVDGHTILLSDGAYDIANTIDVNKGVTLQGQSESGVALTCTTGLVGSYGLRVTANGATLKDFTMDGNGTAVFGIHVQPGTSNSNLEGLTALNCVQNGIALTGTNDVEGRNFITDITVQDNGLLGLGIGASQNVTVSDVISFNNAFGDIGMYIGDFDGQPNDDLIFEEPLSLSGGAGGISYTIEADDPAGFEIESSTAEITDALYNASANIFVPAAYNHRIQVDVPEVPTINPALTAFLLTQDAVAPTIAAAFNVAPNDNVGVRNLASGHWEVSPGLQIQEAVDLASGGDVVEVFASTYEENVTVDKSLTLLGDNANTTCDSRVAESLIAPSSGAPVTITADGVIINGFEMTAPNNGFAVEYSNTSDVSILYNNIHDIGNDPGFGGPPTNGNTVHAVRYQLDGGSYSNIDVSNNCFTAIGHDGNTFNSTSAIAFLQSTSLGTLTNVNIIDNSISNVRAANVDWTLGGRIAYGILINVGGNSGFATNGKVADATIDGNTIDDLDGFISTGIGLEGNTENALVQLNVISNLSGAKIGADRSGGGLDLQALKFEKNRYVGTVTVVHNSFATNTYVHDGTPNLGYGVANYVDASLYGIADVTCNWFGTADPFEIQDNASLDGKILNKAGAESTFLSFLVNDDINNPDCSGTGPVANLTQGTSHMTIQDGVDAAIANDVLLASAGTYDENVTIDKVLTLEGANANTSCDSRGAESLIFPASGAPVTITADGVTINGFEMTAPTNGFAVEYSNTSDVSILFNNIHDVGNDPTFGGPPTNGNTVHAVRYQLDGGSYSNIDVSNNCFTAIGHDGNTFNSTSAIAFLQSTSQGTLTTVNIVNNDISNVRAANVDWTLGGRIAYGILINVGGNSGFATNGKVADATIEGNTIDDLDGFISTGIGLEGNTENAVVQLNVISNLSGAKIGADRSGGGLDLQALKFEKNRYVGTVTVVHNSFATNTYVHDGTPNLGYGVANYVDASLYGIADVTCNWFGTADPFEIQDNANLDGKILNKAGAESTFLSFLVNDDIDNPDCSGTGPVANLTQGTSHMTIQDGVDAANANDVLEIQVADFTEPAQAVIDKDLTLQGTGKSATILRPGEDTGTSGDTRAFILVDSGVNFTLQDLTVDGTGMLVWQAIRQKGEGSVQNVRFTEIKYNPSTNYAGTAIAAFGTGNVDVSGCEFDEIGRVGVLYFGTGINGSDFNENTYTGKGPGDWLDYALDISSGAKVNATANTISGNRGEATVDGSTSAGILVSTFFGPGTEATVTNNFISDNTTAVFVGFNASDASTATVNNNSLTNNDNGVISTAASVDATCNWLGSAVYDDIALLVSGPVSFNPALLGGGDNDLVTAGFQPAAACGNTDFVPPTAVCQNITLSLDASGQAEILDPADLDGGSTDNAGIASFAIDVSNFDCTNLGANNVTLTVTDINGNTSTCIAIVTVEDNIAPTVNCAASDVRTLDQSNLTYLVVGSEFDPTVSDNCDFEVAHDAGSIANAVSTGDNTTLAGWQLPIGDHDIVFTVTDDDNNVVTCTVTVEVLPIELSANVTIVNDCTPREVRVRVYPAGGNAASIIGEYTGTILSGGSFSLNMPDVAPGTYDIYVKPEGYLQRAIEGVTVSPSGPLISVTGLKAGDVSDGVAILGLNGSFNDNFINNLDLSLLLAHYNSIDSQPNYNSRANFNCDNFVDALDLSFISFFYFVSGDKPNN